MKRIALGTIAALVLFGVVTATDGIRESGTASGQAGPALAVDADPAGNEATSLSTIDGCASISVGDTFQVDITITDVVDLLAWEVQFVYDPSIVTLEGRDAQMFLAANAGSNVFDASHGTPDEDGLYRVAAADIADPPAPDSGSGVLARLTLSAVSAGVSPASLPLIDATGDGKANLGPTLTDDAGQHLGDTDEDGFFDGPVADAWIAVDVPCPEEPPSRGLLFFPLPTASPGTTPVVPSPSPSTPVPSPTDDSPQTPVANGSPASDDDGLPWMIALIAGGVAALAAAGVLVGWLARRRPR